MEKQKFEQSHKTGFAVLLVLVGTCLVLGGCEGLKGYSNESLYPDDVCSVYVEMFENKGFRRGIEYQLTDALAKRIEAGTPYKIISNRNRADTVINGYIEGIRGSTYIFERETGRALENAVELEAVVNWKNLKTGELLIDHRPVRAAASYSEWQSQSFEYASTLAANRLAERIVELMEKGW